MQVAKGILTSRGGMTSHAAVVARGMGKPCIVGAGKIEVNERLRTLTVAKGERKLVVKEGEWVSFDGTTGQVYLGPANTIPPDPKSESLLKFMAIAEERVANVIIGGVFGIIAVAVTELVWRRVASKVGAPI